jgi:Family of unknown function (DUF5995)
VRAARVFLAAGAVLAVAACGSSSHAVRYTTWAQAVAGMRASFDPHSADPCERGDVSCLDLLIAEMKRRDRAESSACVHRALFTRMYLRTTQALRESVRARRFRHGPAIVHFGAWFARLGFLSEDRWNSRRAGDIPAVWRVAFAAEDNRRVRSMGDLLLGINAHISRDLAFTVAAAERGRGTAEDPDFKLFTSVIESKTKPVIAELARRFDPVLAAAAVPLSLGGAATVGQLIGAWRDEAWRNGVALRDAHGADRAAVAARIENVAQLRAESIVAATAYLPLVQSSRRRDAYCAAHRDS